MVRSTRIAVALAALLFPAGAFAPSVHAQTSPKPAAHVYIASGKHILAYSAAANGKLTAVPGSPFNYALTSMGANGHYLFGFEPGSVIIDSFAMATNGALKKAATTNTQKYWPLTDCPLTYYNGQGFRIDHSGLELYNAAIPEDLFCYSTFQSYRINDANGKLTYQTDTDKIFYGGPVLSILGNNNFAYSPNCAAAFGNGPSPNVTVFQRVSNGQLDTVARAVPIPAAPVDTSNPDPGGPYTGYYCPASTATDPTNHMAMTLWAYDPEDSGSYGQVVIATFTADSRGNMTTTSTYKNMPISEVGFVGESAMRMSPSGKLLAIGGGGLELFHFNGGNQVTKYKMLLAGDGISQILWDNANHMYALGTDNKGNGKLWIYTVTPTSVTAAPGSPYSIASPGGMAVQPL